MECYCYPRNVQDLLSANGVLENQFVGQLFSFGSMIGNHPISVQDQTRRPQLGQKSSQESSLAVHCTRGEFGREIASW